jgi:hypothetical protein
MANHKHILQVFKNYILITKAYYQLLGAYLENEDKDFAFMLNRKELLVLGFEKVGDFHGEWLDSKTYDPSEWENIRCCVIWDKTTELLYRDDLQSVNSKDTELLPIPEDTVIKKLVFYEPADAIADLICGYLENQNHALQGKFSNWPGTPVFENYFPKYPEHVLRYTVDDVEANKTEYLCRLGSLHELDHTKPAGTGQRDEPARHCRDFSSVHWYGTDYNFTKQQAAAVRILWAEFDNGTPDVMGETLIEEISSESRRVSDIFKGNPAWNTIIQSGQRKGSYRLVEPNK